MLPRIRDDECELGFVESMTFAQARHPENLVVAPFPVRALSDEGNLAGVIVETDAGEALVGDTFVQFEETEVAVIHALFREGAVESYEERFVFRANGPDEHIGAVFEGPGAD